MTNELMSFMIEAMVVAGLHRAIAQRIELQITHSPLFHILDGFVTRNSRLLRMPARGRATQPSMM